MPLISYSPGIPPSAMLNANKTIGPVANAGRTGSLPATSGTIATSQVGSYPQFGMVGRFADAGEVADCLNQLVARIEALEAVLAVNPAYGVTQT